MKIKLGVSLVLAFLAFVFITQNTETVQVRFVAWSIEMSLVLLVFIMLGSGVIIGWLLNSYFRFLRNRKPQDKPAIKSQSDTASTKTVPVSGRKEEKDE